MEHTTNYNVAMHQVKLLITDCFDMYLKHHGNISSVSKLHNCGPSNSDHRLATLCNVLNYAKGVIANSLTLRHPANICYHIDEGKVQSCSHVPGI